MAVDWCGWIQAQRRAQHKEGLRVALGLRPRTLGGCWLWLWYWSPLARLRRRLRRGWWR